MKKWLCVLLICFCVFTVGCDSETQVNCAHISNITSALSNQYAIKVVLDDDERVQEKYVSLQIKSSVENLSLTFGEEMEDDYVLSFPKADYWYNLTYLISQTNGVGTEAGYLDYEEYGDRVFRFSAEEDVKLTFRMVAGATKVNEETGEEILVLSEPISKEVEVDVKKN